MGEGVRTFGLRDDGNIDPIWAFILARRRDGVIKVLHQITVWVTALLELKAAKLQQTVKAPLLSLTEALFAH
ncbi:unnamed protein product [Phytomonas sp. Hart1]|nr:unnamed protein product [Phytomonas sp. Hart1]|eukprot:CCW67122.1 unnamed protein product [Phytomonas sp. isolate Hart1]